MSLFFGGGSKSKPQYSGLQIQTSSRSLPVPWCRGTNRLAPNIIWYGDFKTHKKKQKAGKGGPSITTYTYSASLALALCEGEVVDVLRVFRDKEKQTGYADLGFSLFTGENPQDPWGYLSSAHPTEAYGYPGVSYLAAANYDLGDSATVPSHSFEVEAQLADTDGIGNGDALPSTVISDFLFGEGGCGLDPTILDQSSFVSSVDATTTGDSSYETYCRVMGFGLSPFLVDEEEAGAILSRWAELTHSEIVWTGYSLKIVPYGSQELSANGYHYVPDHVSIAYSLDDSDYISDGDDPVLIIRKDQVDASNSVKIEIRDREDEYNEVPVSWEDQSLIEQFGYRPASTIKAHEICEREMAITVVSLIGSRRAYVMNEYEFVLGPAHVLLEPSDIVTLTDPELGVVQVYVETIEEDDDGNFSCTGREYVGEVNSLNPSGAYFPTTVSTAENYAAAPGPVNPPIIFEPPASLSGPSAQVWVAVSGGDGNTANDKWGGAVVYVSKDNVTYDAIGEIDGPARMGKLTSPLPDYNSSNPDAVNTLSVNLSMSSGELESASPSTAAAGATVCIIKRASDDGYELLSFTDAVLTSGSSYNLDNLYRGLYNTSTEASSAADQFARLDDEILKVDLIEDYVGSTLYFKFQSFNVWNNSYEDLSTCAVYTYDPVGIGYGIVPGAPQTVASTPAVLSNRLSWSAPTTGDDPTSYRIYGALGSSVSFGLCTLLGVVSPDVRIWSHSGLGVSETWTYYLVAVNGGGAGVESSGVNGTTGSGGGGGSISPWKETGTGTGASQNITLPYAGVDPNGVFVFVNGLRFSTSQYSISGTTLTLTTNASGDAIEIIGIVS